MSAAAIAKALAGRSSGNGGFLVRCPVPTHGKGEGDRHPSLSLRDGADALLVRCFAGCDPRDILDELRRRGLLEREHPALDGRRDRRKGRHVERIPPAQRSDADRTRHALTIWHEAGPLAGTPAEAYLASRGVAYQGEALRWHPACPFGKQRLGSMVALVRNVATDEPQAVHRTALGPDGRKLSQLGANGRLSLGPIGGGAVKLTADSDVTLSVAIGEGIESTLSLRKLAGCSELSVWALLSASGVASFPALPSIETLWIAVDNDAAGIKTSRDAAARWQAAGREVVLIAPTATRADLNNITILSPEYDHAAA